MEFYTNRIKVRPVTAEYKGQKKDTEEMCTTEHNTGERADTKLRIADTKSQAQTISFGVLIRVIK